MPAIVPAGANIYVQLLTPGKLTFDDVSLKRTEKVPEKAVKIVPGKGEIFVKWYKTPSGNAEYDIHQDEKIDCYLQK